MSDVVTDRIRLATPDVGEAEIAAFAEVVSTGMLTMGPKVTEFEQGLAEACGTDDAIVVSSGTAALHLAVLALGIGPGDEVIVPAYTFPATANVVELCGARAVLVDVDPDTFNVDIARVADAVTPRTKAVLAVHLFGRPVEWEELQTAVPQEVVARRGRRRRARRALPGHALRVARPDGLPVVPSAQDRHHRRGRGGHDRRARARRRDPAAPPPRHRAARRLRHSGAGAQLPAARPPLRDRDPAARAARAAARRARARRRVVHRAARAPLPDAVRGRGRPPRLAGLRDPARPPRRGAHGASRRRHRGADRDVRAAPPRRLPRPRPFPGADRAFARALALPFASDDDRGRVRPRGRGALARFV